MASRASGKEFSNWIFSTDILYVTELTKILKSRYTAFAKRIFKRSHVHTPVCVCVCVCVLGRDRGKDIVRGTESLF